MDSKNLVEKVALDVAEKGGRLYYVGGYVRDNLIGKENKDIDVECIGLKPKEYLAILSKYGNVDKVGEAFGVYIIKGYDIDFTMARRENKIGKNHTDFEVVVDPTMTVEDACKRRDFTINALSRDVLTGEIKGDLRGLEDLKNKRIRYVDKTTFIEDELRTLRACQFASRFNFKIDKDVLEISKNFEYHLSRERIEEEMNKLLLKSETPSIGLKYMDKMGIFKKTMPNLKYSPKLLDIVDRMAQISKGDKNRKELMYLALGSQGSLKDITNNTSIIKFHEEIKPFPRPSAYQFRKSIFKGTFKYEVMYKYALGKIDYEQYKELFIRAKSIDGIYTERIVTGNDLLSLGIKPSKEFGNIMNYALEKQFEGYNKTKIINQIKSKL